MYTHIFCYNVLGGEFLLFVFFFLTLFTGSNVMNCHSFRERNVCPFVGSHGFQIYFKVDVVCTCLLKNERKLRQDM